MKLFSKSKLKMAVVITAWIIIGTNLHAEEIQYVRGDRRDPFVPLIGPGVALVKVVAKMDINIQGIIIDQAQGSMVLINGQFYKEGDTVNDMNVISIFSDRVILSQNNEEKTIWMREEILDKPAEDQPEPPKV